MRALKGKSFCQLLHVLSLSLYIYRGILYCCNMTVFIFSFTYHISFSDVFPELISDLFLLLNPNFNSNLDLCMNSQARHTTSVFLLPFFRKDKGVNLPSCTFVKPQNDLNVLCALSGRLSEQQKRKDIREKGTTDGKRYFSPLPS